MRKGWEGGGGGNVPNVRDVNVPVDLANVTPITSLLKHRNSAFHRSLCGYIFYYTIGHEKYSFDL